MYKKEYSRKWRQKNKDRLRDYYREYYQKNKKSLNKYRQEYRQRNRDKERKWAKEWRQNHKERRRELMKKYWEKNKERLNQERRIKYYTNQEYREERLLSGKKYREDNKEKVRLSRKMWAERNREWRRNYDRRYYRKHRLRDSMKSIIYQSLKDKKAGRCWESLVGYTLQDLMSHLESLFDSDMNWDNYGSYWVVDHYIPRSWFKYKSPEDPQFRICWSLENLQPMEKKENIMKSNRYMGRMYEVMYGGTKGYQILHNLNQKILYELRTA